jgi:hypothetical protein
MELCLYIVYICNFTQHDGYASPEIWNYMTFLLPSVLTATVGNMSL